MANRGKTLDKQVHCIKDLERLGSSKMPKAYREYYNEGAMDLITLRENESAYNRYMIRPRVLRNLSTIDTSTTIVGCKVIAHSKGNPYVMQMSLLKNKAAMIQVIKRADAAGFKALFVTLDVPYLGRRLNEYRNNFGVPKGMEYPNLFPGVDVTNLEDGDESMAYDNSLEWPDIVPFIRQYTNMQIWGKGIYTAADAELAIKYGFDGIIISNHGGRQLDSVPASLDVLREIAPVAKGKIPIAVDGGIRRGTDIFKALALGADFCLAGRPAIWGLAYDGQKGVELALNLLYDEFKTCMALAGCKNVSEIQKEHVSLLLPDGRLLKL
ncbi:hypothetical protein KXX45_007894 [Aspergillus fumigatus]|nr:hypothetical protein KXX45_007894 [Aspergillus fumigatus]